MQDALYKHWAKYTEMPDLKGKEYEVVLDSKVEEGFWNFARERMNIWHRRNQGLPQPWTDDPILHKYRFTNVYRELDRHTMHWHNLLKPYENDLNLWFLNILFCRLSCKPEMVAKVGLLTYDQKDIDAKYAHFMALPSPRTGNSYNFAQYESMLMGYEGRHDTLFVHVPKVAKDCAEVIAKSNDEGVHFLVERMVKAFQGRMRFILTEVIMDAGYQWPEHVNEFKEFPIGPGAKPTCQDLNKKAKIRHVAMTLTKHQPKDFPYLKVEGKDVFITTAAIENLLCEFRKYSNIKNGVGKIGETPRARPFKPR